MIVAVASVPHIHTPDVRAPVLASLYAARVRRLVIRVAKNSRPRATAAGPASTISRGSVSSARVASDVRATSHRPDQHVFAHPLTSSPLLAASPRRRAPHQPCWA